MWKGPNEDPGPPGTSEQDSATTQQSPELTDSHEEQLFLSQFQQIIGKSEQSTVSQQKVEEYANTLARAKRNKLKKGSESDQRKSTENVPRKVDSPANEKVLLLRQQMEENKAKLAARGKNQKGIEDIVTQIRAKLDDSQHLITQSTSSLNVSVDTFKRELNQANIEDKDKYINSLLKKMDQLEGNVLDLQENLKEKDSVIDARTKAITLMSENLSKKSKTTVDTLEDTKEQMRKMQNNFIELEEKLKQEKQKLLQQIYEKDEEIGNLKDAKEELQKVNEELIKLNDGLQEKLNNTDGLEKTIVDNKGMEELQEKINELEEQLKNTDVGKSSPQKSRRNRKPSKQRVETNQNTEMEAKITFQQSIISDKQQEIDENQEKIKELEAFVQELKTVVINLRGGKEFLQQQESSTKTIEIPDNSEKERIKQLESLVEELREKTELKTENLSQFETIQTELEEYKSKVKVLQLEKQALTFSDNTTSEDSEELTKLKKQLDESNKNMIKARAQHKSQMKELTKKLDAYKKSGESSLDLGHLEGENGKLLQKIAELEEEIGNMQLKMVESIDSTKDFTTSMESQEADKEFREKLEEKNEQISNLEIDLTEYKSQIDQLNSKLENLSQYENAQVKSDLTSIQLEEQLEKLESQNKVLLDEKNEILSTLETLQETLKSLECEKKELTLRVEQLSQENIELNDRMEKLSAEKVSSAESIEIVEGLTNLEKLEIEAYQKNLTCEPQKSEENLSEGNPELNESVNQLTEETAELLQKIELFTVERREVMEKLEQLTTENSQLLVRIKEVEDSRDSLRESFENLKVSKEEVLRESDELKACNEQIQGKLDDLLDEKKLGENEVGTLTNKLVQLKQELEEIKLNSAQEIENYLSIIEENKQELITSSSLICKLQNETLNYEESITNLNEKIGLLNDTITQQKESMVENESINIMSIEIDELKCLVNNKNSRIQEYEINLKENSDTMCELNNELTLLRNNLNQTERKLIEKGDDLEVLIKTRDELTEELEELKLTLSDKDESFQQVVTDLKHKCLSLQSELESNQTQTALSARITELETKNKEFRDKMKIIAANLKKKTGAYDALVKDSNVNKEKWELESKEKDEKVQSLSVELEQLTLAFDKIRNDYDTVKISYESLEKDFNLCKNDLQASSLHNSELQHTINDLTNSRKEYEAQINYLTQDNEMIRSGLNNAHNSELSEKDDTISRLTTEVESLRSSSDTNSNTLRLKVQELEVVIESQEQEITRQRTRVEKLEEGLANVEERRMSVERKAIELGAKLQEKEINFEEIIQHEDHLEKRLRLLAEHDAAVEQKLMDSVEENRELSERNVLLQNENVEYHDKLTIANNRVADVTANLERLLSLESDNVELRQTVKTLESNLAKVEKQFQDSLQMQKSDNEIGELELHDEIERFHSERKVLVEKCEMLEEQLKEFQESHENLNSIIHDYRGKLVEQEGEIARQSEELEKLVSVESILQSNLDLKTIEVSGVAKELEEKQKVIVELQTKLDNSVSELNENMSQLSFAKNMMQQIEENNMNVLGRNDELETKIAQLERDSNKPEVVTEMKQASALFTMPVEEDPFAFALPTEAPVLTKTEATVLQSSTDNNTIDIQNKVRTLEFMLYNMEQEKDDLVNQCHQMSNELARLVYDKENPKFSDMDSQIVLETEAQISREDCKAIKEAQYTPCNVANIQQDSVDFGISPIVEELVQAKSAYLCFDKEASTTSAVFGGENDDDGWGFTTVEDNSAVQQEQASSVEAVPNNNQQLIEEINMLKLEREKHLEDIRQAQVKSGKLIRKLREFKAKNDQLAAKLDKSKKSDGFDELEGAIQDELKSQVDTLEKKVKEIQHELEKEKTEKGGLLTRVDVLTSANERMVEMKEKQDVEMLAWHHRNRELTSKLEQFEWGSDDHVPPEATVKVEVANTIVDSTEIQQQIEELNNTIKDLTLDNEELQSMLEEQRGMRLTAEKQKPVELTVDDIKATSEYLLLLNENKAIKNDAQRTVDENLILIGTRETLESAIIEYKISLEQLQKQLEALQTENSNLRSVEINNETINVANQQNEVLVQEKAVLESTITDYKTSVQQLQEQVDYLQNEQTLREVEINGAINFLNQQNAVLAQEKITLESTINEYIASIEQLHNQVELLQSENHNLKATEAANQQNSEILDKVNNLTATITLLEAENIRLKEELTKSSTEIVNLTETIRILTEEKSTLQEQVLGSNEFALEVANLRKEVAEKQTLLTDLETKLQTKDSEYELKLATTVEELAQEWSIQVDQRGSDIAESWKFHLDSKENEFMRLEQDLRKEVNELEEKCNGLVNENNELRKNVDADIRNEVDRISALQQQINDKQHCINELGVVLDEKKHLIEQLQARLNENEVTIQELNGALQDRDQKVVEVERIVEAIKLEIAAKQNNISELLEKLDYTTKDEGNKETELRENHSRLSQLQKELLNQQEKHDVIVSDLNYQLTQQKQTLLEERSEKDLLAKSLDEFNKGREFEGNTLDELNQKVAQYQQDLLHCEKQSKEKDEIITGLTEQINNQAKLDEEVQSKDATISHLNQLLYDKEQELTYLTESQQLESSNISTQLSQEIEILNKRLLETDNRYEELLAVKDADVQNARVQLEELSYRYEAEQLVANDRIAQIVLQQQQLAEQEAFLTDEAKQLQELRELIESQVLKIETLKEALYAKSSDYDALFAEVEVRVNEAEKPAEKHVQFAEDLTSSTMPASTRSSVNSPDYDDMSEPASRAELDLALYMLHQRDVRCEELTVELMQLLEERDTLQLRLSNAIREKETMRAVQHRKDLMSVESEESDRREGIQGEASGGSIVPTRAKAILLEATKTEMAAEAIEAGALSDKLSELKSIGYKRDKTLVDEQDQRRLQQMSILQQHMDEAAKLPAEAAARLVDANYTLSRDVQSPSKVLLNWLWGRSTPKVNNV